MQIHKIPFSQIPQLSERDKAYATDHAGLKSFYKYPVQIEAFAQVIADKQKETINRELLVKVLQEQYAQLDMGTALTENIKALLNERTFTVTTAHQPSLFTGPLYYIYKIISTINLAKKLRQTYPDYQFVPVFITGGEDHDFEEVQNANLFNQTLTWESGETGSVGMMRTASIQAVLEQLKNILGESENALHIYQLIEDAHTQNQQYSAATVQMVHHLFKADGLVVLNMNEPQLKAHFAPIVQKELELQPSLALVNETSAAIHEIGFKPQATPRDINFFYLSDQSRERIVAEDNVYKVLNTDFVFTTEEMRAELAAHPERFSPNVVMRPIYQEYILPNLAYVGGGGELAYWMERQSQFEYFGINYPMLIRRNSVMWIDKGLSKKMHKLQIDLLDWFKETEGLIKEYITHQSTATLSLEAQKTELTKVFTEIQAIAGKVNPTLEKTVLAEQAKQLKGLEHLETKLIRAEKQKHEVALNQIRSTRDKLFPGNGLQERKDNFLPLYLKYGETFFEVLKENLDPLDRHFIVIEDKVEA